MFWGTFLVADWASIMLTFKIFHGFCLYFLVHSLADHKSKSYWLFLGYNNTFHFYGTLSFTWYSESRPALFTPISFNSLWSSDAMWQLRSGSTLAQVMLVFWLYQTITQTKVDLSSKMFLGIHLRAITQELFLKLIHNMYSGVTLLKSLSHLPGTISSNSDSKYTIYIYTYTNSHKVQ